MECFWCWSPCMSYQKFDTQVIIVHNTHVTKCQLPYHPHISGTVTIFNFAEDSLGEVTFSEHNFICPWCAGDGICSHTCIYTYTLFSMSSCQLVLLELLISQSYFYACMCVHTHVSCAKAWISNTLCFMKPCAACFCYCLHVLCL